MRVERRIAITGKRLKTAGLACVIAGAAAVLPACQGAADDDCGEIVQEYASLFLEMDGDGYLYSQALEAAGDYLSGDVSQAEALETMDTVMDEMEDRRDSVEEYTVSSEMSVLLEAYGIMPEEFESFANTRDSDLYSYLISLETVRGCLLYAEEFAFEYENLSYYYELDTGIHESERGYYYYGCLNYWFAEWEEEQVDLVREQVISQMKDYLPSSYTWETDPDVVEQKAMLYLDEVEAYKESLTEHLGEQKEDLMSVYDKD
ncbi:MAG: hypothetical protein LIO75_00065 [Lachnospiraceae bacterium]|nr:hypothetical protein [Lachnospiraceae bacterium]